MPSSLLLALRYISYHQARTLILIAALSLTFFLPLASRWTIQRFEQHAMARAGSTPLIVAKKGSRFAVAIHALYFRGEPPQELTQAQVKRIEDTDLAQAIPIFARFRAQDTVIVGTSANYFTYRGLQLERGGPLRRIGDCVLGAAAAARLDISPGDRLLSEPENLFDLAGPSPLNMRVTGILRPTGTADDETIFCDLKTTWIMSGIGHGHVTTNVAGASDHQHSAGREYMPQYAEVTDENVNSFHFHGQPDDYPLTAIIALPDSARSEALLMGKFLLPDETHQVIRPVEVVRELMQVVSQVRQWFDVGLMLLAIATLLLVSLVLTLSVRLRQKEMRTMFLLGCSRSMIARIIMTELALVTFLSVTTAVALAACAARFSDLIFYSLT